MHVLTLNSPADWMVLTPLGDVLLSHKGSKPSWQYSPLSYRSNNQVTHKRFREVEIESYHACLPSDNHTKVIILVLWRNLTQLMKPAYFIKRIYQEGSSYLTNLKTAFAFKLYTASTSVKFHKLNCTAKKKKKPLAFSNSGMRSSSSLVKDIRQKEMQKTGEIWQQHNSTAK